MGCQLLADTFNRPHAPFKVMGRAISREEIGRLLKLHPCDVALISDNLSDGPLTGFHAYVNSGTLPQTKAVMLLKSKDYDLVIDAFRAGAKGVYCRTEPLKSLAKSIWPQIADKFGPIALS